MIGPPQQRKSSCFPTRHLPRGSRTNARGTVDARIHPGAAGGFPEQCTVGPQSICFLSPVVQPCSAASVLSELCAHFFNRPIYSVLLVVTSIASAV